MATTPRRQPATARATASRTPTTNPRESHSWTLLTSHGRVLLLIARDPGLKVREIAERAQITERAASGITADLEVAGYLTKQRQGRRMTYVVHHDAAFRHPAESDHTIGELIGIFVRD